MSADNGIYILETSGPEFRVVECSAIDNITYDADDNGLNREFTQKIFGGCKV